MNTPTYTYKDPTRDELIDLIVEAFPHHDFDPFDVEEAIYWFAADYHHGQFSNLYSILSTSDFSPSILANGPTFGSPAEVIYTMLVSNHNALKTLNLRK